jgi:hypothetical protein
VLLREGLTEAAEVAAAMTVDPLRRPLSLARVAGALVAEGRQAEALDMIARFEASAVPDADSNVPSALANVLARLTGLAATGRLYGDFQAELVRLLLRDDNETAALTLAERGCAPACWPRSRNWCRISA